MEAASNQRVSFQIIGADSGLLSSPVTANSLLIHIAERWEIVVDFASYAGKNITMRNARDVFQDEDYGGTNRVMQFNVGRTVSSTVNNGAVPSKLADLHLPPSRPTQVDRTFRFERS